MSPNLSVSLTDTDPCAHILTYAYTLLRNITAQAAASPPKADGGRITHNALRNTHDAVRTTIQCGLLRKPTVDSRMRA